ncbi:Plastid movement impaired [Thalictrum thalictroides]|uniref:Plastid movement impaired n=1 Tax=Thalictrum thalictroides TaxID=46969 RepID=A0A7J6VWF4_THATH|nr:Plastid movement impaired [Thalictrum thalictroides]
MDRTESCSSQDTIGSVKQAVNFYGGKLDGSPNSSEKAALRAEGLHMVKKDISQFNENKRVAEQMRSQPESEISNAKKTVKDLSLRIEESKFRTRTRKWELDTLRRPKRRDDNEALIGTERDNYQYAEVMKELDSVKRDLSKLKLDMAYLLETKTRLDKESETSTSRMRSYSSSIEGLRKEIEEVNEEQVLVELARIEAFREYEAIQAQREAEATEFASAMENTRKKMNEIVHEIDRSKELEAKLAITTSDANVLQNELKLVKAMGESFKRNESPVEVVQAITDELEAAYKELRSIKEEGFQFMASMDIVRNELKHVSEENARLKNLEIRADSTVKNLNLKLLRAKSKLEYITSAEEKAKDIVANLTATLQQLTTEAEASKKEKEIITETASKIRAEAQKIESEIDVAEGKLRVAMKEFEEVKASEAFALESLKYISEKTMKDRVSASLHSSTITISNFEYQYLSGRAEGVEEIADKKVAAAQAWIEALKASEKEILMKTEIALREMRELKLVEEQKQEVVYKQDKEPNLRKSSANMELAVALPPRKSIKDNGNSTAVRRPMARRSNSPSTRYVNRSGSITLKKKTKVMPNLGKLFASNKTG